MSFEKVPYDKQRLETIRIRLESHARAGDPITYCISVDGMEIIPKTDDATLFSEIYELLGEKTNSVSYSEYIGNTRNRNTTCFYFPGAIPNGQTLQGIDTAGQNDSYEERVRKDVLQITQKQNNDRLQRENQTLKQQINALLEKCDTLKEEKEEVISENEELKRLQDENAQTNMLLSLGKDALDRWLGPKKDTAPLEGVNQPEHTAEEQQNKENATHVAVPENEYNDFKFYTEFIKRFEPAKRGLLTNLNRLLSEHPELVDETYFNLFQKIQNGDEEK